MLRGDGGLEELVGEECLEILRDLLGEVGAVVVHGEYDAFEGEAALKAWETRSRGAHELGDAFEGKVLGLHGDEEAVGGYERVKGEEVEGRGAVEDDEGVVGADWLESIAELVLTAGRGR